MTIRTCFLQVFSFGFLFFILGTHSASAASFTMQTGYYIGNGTSKQITGVGFAPNLVIVSDETSAGDDGAVFRTTTMSGDSTAKMAEAEANATALITSLDVDGFTVGSDADVNGANLPMRWIAFGGSDCSSNGTFCVGSYSGNGSSKSISTGFQPDLVTIKRSGASLGVWRSASMGSNATAYFSANNADTSGQFIQSLDATSFSVGNNATVNTNGDTYWFFAFKKVSSLLTVGTYTGDGADNRAINSSLNSELTFQPDFVWEKQETGAAARAGVFNITEQLGDNSCSFIDAVSSQNMIQQLTSGGGFQVGSGLGVNENTYSVQYVAFGGASDTRASSGSFKMISGSYSGSPSAITGLGFSPDLVIIKSKDTAQYGVFRTSMMAGDSTAYLANTAANFTGGIVSLDSDGFTLGANATVSGGAGEYAYVAFGNAWRPDKNSGASDFMVGSYVATEVDNTDVARLPFASDLVAIKRYGGNLGVWRSSQDSGDMAQFFSATGEAADIIQTINSDGFQIGLRDEVSAALGLYHYFAFKSGSKFFSGSYTGNGGSQNIGSLSFLPNFLWTKKRSSSGGSTPGVFNISSYSKGSLYGFPFTNLTYTSNDIGMVLPNGFVIGGTNSNANTYSYRYAAWLGSGVTAVASGGTQTSTAETPSTNQYMGGVFSFSRDSGHSAVKSVTITEKGTVNAQNDLKNIKLYGEYDNTAPYNCASESFSGTEAQFGSTDTDGFSATNGTVTFDFATPADLNDASVKTFCGYVVLDVGSGISSGQTIELEISNPSADVSVWDGTVSPGSAVAISGTTSIVNAGTLSVDVVDGSGNSVSSPTASFGSRVFSWSAGQSSGTLGASSQKIRVTNTVGASTWNLLLAATGGTSAQWQSGSNTYDFNGAYGGGYLVANPSGATVTPQDGCSTTGITKGNSAQFSVGSPSITLLSASASADRSCFWEMTGISLLQDIPARQATGSYSIDMTLTII